ncbi:hypothetical protein AKUH4B504J_01060 [Apilactobacillus kunkeei]|uniref:DUF805 domain-containing protein n=1 Tax=Apilactobacillus kunkeei TaxID=148814 RepID=UPI0021E22F19|nr:hypothetical protein AKUH4B504J_01060 [Apilactobacillus kunkeei]
MEEKHCQICGHALPIDAKFCNNCGAKQVDIQQVTDAKTVVPPVRPEVSFFGAIKDMFKRLFTIKGCSSRSEYWYAQLFLFICFTLAQSILIYAHHSLVHVYGDLFAAKCIMGVISLIFGFFMVVEFCLTFRRLHDSDMSGGFLWLLLVPICGFIVLIVLLCLPTKTGGYIRFGDYVKPSLTANVIGLLLTAFLAIAFFRTHFVFIYHYNYVYDNDNHVVVEKHCKHDEDINIDFFG